MFDLFMIVGVVLTVLWFLGLVSSYTLGGFINVALVVGLVFIAFSLVTRRRRYR